MGNWKKSRVCHELRVVLSSLIGFSLRALSDDVSHIFMSAPDWMRWLLTQEVYFYWWFRLLSKGKARSLEAHTNEITIRTTGWKISETCGVCTTGWQPKMIFAWTRFHMSGFFSCEKASKYSSKVQNCCWQVYCFSLLKSTVSRFKRGRLERRRRFSWKRTNNFGFWVASSGFGMPEYFLLNNLWGLP